MKALISKIARTTVSAFLSVGGGVASPTPAGSFGILMYHGITSDILPVPNWCQLSSQEFESQIEYLSAQYTVLTLSEVVDRVWSRKSLPKSTVCITFDDGFRNVYTSAFPILQRCQVPSTIFVVTGLVGTRQPAWPDLLSRAISRARCDSVQAAGRTLSLASPRLRFKAAAVLGDHLKRLDNDQREREFEGIMTSLGSTAVDLEEPQASMDWAEIDVLSRSGLFEFGSHTQSHPILSRCPRDRQVEELGESRKLLIERLGKCDHFAYPNGREGDYTAETKAILAGLGYRCGVTTRSGLNGFDPDPFELRRINVGNDTTGRRFRLRMAGL